MPKVFVSYSHDSEQHAEKVRLLADRLRADGVDCILDQYVPAPTQGWALWMEQQIAAADFVLVVASATYQRRASGNERPGVGHGARFESVLLIQELYDAGMHNEKLIPVLLPGAARENIPRPLRGYTHHRLRDDGDYERLYRHLTAQPLVRKPTLGEPRTLPPRLPAPTRDTEPEEPPTTEERPVGEFLPTSAPRNATRSPLRWRWLLLVAALALGALLLWRIEMPASRPALYSLRIQVLDPDGRPVSGSTVKISAAGERRQLEDGWWQIEIPAATLPTSNRVTLWAEHPDWRGARTEVELGEEANARVEIRLQPPQSMLRGQVLDRRQRRLEGARVTATNYAAGITTTRADGTFELRVAATRGKRVRITVEHDGYPPEATDCYAGRDGCSVILEEP